MRLDDDFDGRGRLNADNCWRKRPRQVDKRLGSETDRHTGQVDGVVGGSCSKEVDFACLEFVGDLEEPRFWSRVGILDIFF